MILKLISLITGRRIVFLEDFEGEVYKTLEIDTPFGKTCYVYWFTKVGHVKLNSDGTTSGRDYIHKWTY